MNNNHLSAFLTSPDEYIFKALHCRLLLQGHQEFCSWSIFNLKIGNINCYRLLQGILYITQNALVFRPQDHMLGMYRIMITDMTNLDKSKPPKVKFTRIKNTKWISFSISKITRMKMNGVSHNYETIDCSTILFEVQKDELQSILDQINSLIRVVTQKDEELFLKLIVASEKSFIFELSCVSPSESILFQDKITVIEYNRRKRCNIGITNVAIYLQFFEGQKMRISFKQIQFAEEQGFRGKDEAIELFLWNNESIFCRFSDKSSRDKAYSLIPCKPESPTQIIEKWRTGEISNFDYLMFLNRKASRTMHDYSHYYIFPWVIKDYSSEKLDLKNPSVYRDLKKLGTQITTAKSVLYYLMRKDPDTVLQMNNGQFEPFDTLFCDVKEAYLQCSPQDVVTRELIPEFYMNDYSLFVNSQDINFSVIKCDVQLPPWAKNYSDFCRWMRLALESSFVSENLHHWVDLVFGYKQIDVANNEKMKYFEVMRKPRKIFNQAHVTKIVEVKPIVDTKEVVKLEELTVKLQQQLNIKSVEMESLKEKLEQTEKAREKLKSKIRDYMNQPIFKSVDNINQYLNKLKKELEHSKLEEQLRAQETERTHKQMMEWKKKYELQKEKTNELWQRLSEYKSMKQQQQQLFIAASPLRSPKKASDLEDSALHTPKSIS